MGGRNGSERSELQMLTFRGIQNVEILPQISKPTELSRRILNRLGKVLVVESMHTSQQSNEGQE